jgi:hypothetical protein
MYTTRVVVVCLLKVTRIDRYTYEIRYRHTGWDIQGTTCYFLRYQYGRKLYKRK